MIQLNERLGHVIAAREIDRLTDADSRVPRSLGELLRITQQELDYTVELSRQRVN